MGNNKNLEMGINQDFFEKQNNLIKNTSKKKSEMIMISLKVDEVIYDDFKKISYMKKIKYSELIRQLIKKFVDENHDIIEKHDKFFK